MEREITYDFDTFRKNFRSLLNSRGYNLQTFMDATKITSASASRYLSGQRDPNVAYVIKIAQFFNVSVDWLLGVSNERYDLISPENREIIAKYSVAKEEDKQVIKMLLSKYEV